MALFFCSSNSSCLNDLYRYAASPIALYPRRSEPQSLRWYTAIELALFQHLPNHPLPIARTCDGKFSRTADSYPEHYRLAASPVVSWESG